MTSTYNASNQWALQVAEWQWNQNTFTPEQEDASDIALLETRYDFIGVPDPLYIDMWAEFELYEWTCLYNGSTPQDNYCYIEQNCRNFVDVLPEFTLLFNQDAGSTPSFAVNIFPEVYLFENGDNECISLLRQVNDDREQGFILGTPFFRNVSVYIDFADDAITIASKDVDSPISSGGGGGGDWDDTKQMMIDLTLIGSGQYQGPILVGDPAQGADQPAAYASDSYYTVIPSANAADVSDGWFDETASSTYSATANDTVVVSVGVWGGICQLAKDTILLKDDAITDGEFCLLTNAPL